MTRRRIEPRQFFRRININYIPITFEGWTAQILFLLIFVGTIFIAVKLSSAIGEIAAGLIGAAIMAPVTASFYRFAHKHS